MAVGRRSAGRERTWAALVLVYVLALAGCGDGPAGRLPWERAASAEVLALADALGLTEDGRALLLDHTVRLVGQREVEEACADALHLENLIGCYRGGDVRSIVVYDVPDERVHDAVLSTVAWGLLMAAWEQVDTFDRAALDLLMQARLDAEPPDSDLAAAVADAAADDPAAARAQAFATVGSRLDEALDPALEAVYARWFSDRVAAVAAGQAPYSLVDATAAELDEAWEAQSALESANAQSRAQLTSDRASLDAAMDRYNEAAAEYNALTPAQRSASTSSWTLWDGTVIPMQPSGDTLAAVREHLVAAPTTFDAREAALAEADAAAAASRADLEAREADLDAMLDALWPDESGDS